MPKIRPMSRDIIASFIKSPEGIREFERLQNVAYAAPDSIEEAAASAQSASSVAQSALALFSELAEQIEPLLTAPVIQMGSIASQNADEVDIDGGTIDGTAIGQNVAAPGSFTTLQSSSTTGLGPTSINGALAVVSSFGCNGKPPQSPAVLAAVTATGATNTTPYGYTTAAQANAIVTTLNAVVQALKNNGIAI